MKRNIKELLDIKSINGKTSVWVCRDWAGYHLFSTKPERINNGNQEDEWSGINSPLNNIFTIRQMVNKYTKNWNLNSKPREITINFEIEL